MTCTKCGNKLETTGDDCINLLCWQCKFKEQQERLKPDNN